MIWLGLVLVGCFGIILGGLYAIITQDTVPDDQEQA